MAFRVTIVVPKQNSPICRGIMAKTALLVIVYAKALV